LIEALLDSLPEEEATSPERKRRTARCLKALHSAILRCGDAEWLAYEARIAFDWIVQRLLVNRQEALPWMRTADGKGDARQL